MELTKEKALELHRQMWTDMQKELGGDPDCEEREKYKGKWCREHFPYRHISNYCFLCQYATEEYRRRGEYINNMCKMCCPIDWGKIGLTDCCDDIEGGGQFYYYAPLDKIINLPEREV